MFDLTPFVQDVIATALAAGAFGILVYRTIVAIRPAPGEAPCTTCASCPKPPAGTAETVNVVPLNNLRRQGSSSEQAAPGIRLIG
jgi:hypothetical protein